MNKIYVLHMSYCYIKFATEQNKTFYSKEINILLKMNKRKNNITIMICLKQRHLAKSLSFVVESGK